MDIYVVRGDYPYGTNVLYRGGADGVFRDVSAETIAAGRRNGIAAAAGDVDGDGKLDLFVANWGTNALYLNRGGPGGMRFEDATRGAGLSEAGRSWGAILTDLDGDGKPDLVVSRGKAGEGEGQKVYLNRGDGTFRDVSGESGLGRVKWSLGAVSADFDGDGDFDLFVGNYDGPDGIFRNDGGGRFTDVSRDSGIRSGRTVGVAAGDIDGDLLPDIVAAGFAGPVRVYRNLGAMRFADVGDRSGIGPWKKNEGVALADVDDDGDLDLYVANYEGRNRLYRNTLDDGRFLKVRIEAAGRPVVGSVARLYGAAGGAAAGRLAASRELQAGHGFCTQSPAEFLFRLPDAGPYDLRVTLPDGRPIERKNVGPGRLVLRPDGEGR